MVGILSSPILMLNKLSTAVLRASDQSKSTTVRFVTRFESVYYASFYTAPESPPSYASISVTSRCLACLTKDDTQCHLRNRARRGDSELDFIF